MKKSELKAIIKEEIIKLKEDRSAQYARTKYMTPILKTSSVLDFKNPNKNEYVAGWGDKNVYYILTGGNNNKTIVVASSGTLGSKFVVGQTVSYKDDQSLKDLGPWETKKIINHQDLLKGNSFTGKLPLYVFK